METARTHLQPAATPYWETIRWDDEKVVGVVSLPANAPDKPYKAKRGSAWVTRIRVGTTTRDATREEEQRLYQQAGWLRYGSKPVPGSSIRMLDLRRLRDYLRRVLQGIAPNDEDPEGWRRLLLNLELLTDDARQIATTVDGMLLFGKNAKRFLPQSGIRAICYVGAEPDFAVRADEDLRGPLVPSARRMARWSSQALLTRRWPFCAATQRRRRASRALVASRPGNTRKASCARL